MSAKGSWSSYNIRSFLELIIYRYRSSSSNASLSASLATKRIDHGYSMHPRLKMTRPIYAATRKNLDTNTMKRSDENVRPPSGPDPPSFNFPTWAKWVLGSILSILLSFWKQKWSTIKKIEGEVEIGVEEVENVAEVVEKVATVGENISGEYISRMAEKLPDNAKLKQAALLIEHISKETAHDAHQTNDFIHKVADLKHDIVDLETMVEPVIEKLVDPKSLVK